jgi:hypothetical protein
MSWKIRRYNTKLWIKLILVEGERLVANLLSANKIAPAAKCPKVFRDCFHVAFWITKAMALLGVASPVLGAVLVVLKGLLTN